VLPAGKLTAQLTATLAREGIALNEHVRELDKAPAHRAATACGLLADYRRVSRVLMVRSTW
jgi:hypothetical protein